MALDTSTKRRSSVALLGSILAPPSPTDSPGTLDQADRQHASFTYAGIEALPPVILPPGPAVRARLPLMAGLLRTPVVDRVTLTLTPPWQRYFASQVSAPSQQTLLARTAFVDRATLTLTAPWQRELQEETA